MTGDLRNQPSGKPIGNDKSSPKKRRRRFQESWAARFQDRWRSSPPRSASARQPRTTDTGRPAGRVDCLLPERGDRAEAWSTQDNFNAVRETETAAPGEDGANRVQPLPRAFSPVGSPVGARPVRRPATTKPRAAVPRDHHREHRPPQRKRKKREAFLAPAESSGPLSPLTREKRLLQASARENAEHSRTLLRRAVLSQSLASLNSPVVLREDSGRPLANR